MKAIADEAIEKYEAMLRSIDALQEEEDGQMKGWDGLDEGMKGWIDRQIDGWMDRMWNKLMMLSDEDRNIVMQIFHFMDTWTLMTIAKHVL